MYPGKTPGELEMNTSVNQMNDHLIEVNTVVSNDANFSQQLQLYYSILSEKLLNKEISLITLQPLAYSFGYELQGDKEIKKIGGKNFLFNMNLTCNQELLFEILQSEEFRRGLLFIVQGQNKELDEIAVVIVQYYKEVKLDFNVEGRLYFTKKDGNTLCLYNTMSTKEEISVFTRSFQ